MVKVALSLAVCVGLLAHSYATVSPEAEKDFEEASKKGGYLHELVKLWQCRPGFVKIADDFKEKYHTCKETFPQNKNETWDCGRICIWRKIGLLGSDGKPNETRANEFYTEMYKENISVKTKWEDLQDCFNKNNPNVNAEEQEKNCGKSVAFMSCLRTKCIDHCKRLHVAEKIETNAKDQLGYSDRR